jgi:hypothetical protein
MNAARAATDDPMRYVYMEGYAVTMGIPVHHGWLYDMRTKRIVDNTWKEQGEAYYGIAVSYETLVEAMNATGVYGIFFTGFLLNRVFNDNEIINLPIGEKIGYTSPLENHSA